MSTKIVGFVLDKDYTNYNYIDNQLKLIKTQIPNLSIELVSGQDPRMIKFCKKADRFPCIMIFKNDIHKTHIHAKLSNKDFIAWCVSKIG